VGTVQVIDPRHSPAWDEFVAQQAEGSVFHGAAWARVLLETYHYQPRYYVLADASGDILAGVPLLLVNSRLTGRRLVGLPFSDLCPPLVRDGTDASPLLESIRRDAQGDHLCRCLSGAFTRRPASRDTSSRWTRRWISCRRHSTRRREGG
jgi:CelD/BcsL family acetyltransferase involved in cellulose biosynthesis